MDLPTRPLDGTETDLVEVVSWSDLHSLPDAIGDLLEQTTTIVDHAQTWVCRTEGFKPSPVCVLRPLVPVLDRVGEAFADLGRALAGELAGIRADVEAALAHLDTADAAAGARLATPQAWDEVA